MTPVLNALILSNKQLEAADTIRRLFLDAGFSEYVAAAAIVSAFRESSLNPKAVSKSGRYVGLFQLSPDLIQSASERKKADVNTLKIIEEVERSRPFMEMALAVPETDFIDLVDGFTRLVERPLDPDLESSKRILASFDLYPNLMGDPPDEVKEAVVAAPAGEDEGSKVLGWLIVGAVVYGAYRVWKGR